MKYSGKTPLMSPYTKEPRTIKEKGGKPSCLQTIIKQLFYKVGKYQVQTSQCKCS